jgi:putative ABC transport system permease protein
MKAAYIQINYWQLAIATLLIIINITLSIILRLGLERSLAIASVRMVVQLVLIGYILEWIFTLSNPFIILAVAVIMASTAGQAGVSRVSRSFKGMYWHSLISVLSTSFVITGFIVTGIFQIEPWYSPQYFIPLLGMSMGNALNGMSLGLDKFLQDLVIQPTFRTLSFIKGFLRTIFSISRVKKDSH